MKLKDLQVLEKLQGLSNSRNIDIMSSLLNLFILVIELL